METPETRKTAQVHPNNSDESKNAASELCRLETEQILNEFSRIRRSDPFFSLLKSAAWRMSLEKEYAVFTLDLNALSEQARQRFLLRIWINKVFSGERLRHGQAQSWHGDDSLPDPVRRFLVWKKQIEQRSNSISIKIPRTKNLTAEGES